MSDRAKQSANLAALAFAIALLLLLLAAGNVFADGAVHQTANFSVKAPNQDLAYKVAETAEAYRTHHWREWFGYDPPKDWESRCHVNVKLANNDGGGSTSFVFDGGKASAFRGEWQGRPDNLLSDVTPHEVMHCVLATELGQPLPRWLDEGICCTVEGPLGRTNNSKATERRLRTGGLFAVPRLMTFTEYPDDYIAFYGQGHSLVSYLLNIGGREKVIEFCKAGLSNGWGQALTEVYGFANDAAFEDGWREWLASPNKRHYVYQRGTVCGPQGCSSGYWYVQENNSQYARQQYAPTVQTKQAQTKPQLCKCANAIKNLETRITHLEKEISVLQERSVLVDEDALAKRIQSTIVVPPGPQGPPGPKGERGADGKDGIAIELDGPELAALVSPHLTHSALLRFDTGRTKLQTKPLLEPLEFLRSDK